MPAPTQVEFDELARVAHLGATTEDVERAYRVHARLDVDSTLEVTGRDEELIDR